MRGSAALVAAAAGLAVIAGACSSDGGSSTPSEAFCSDLRSGLTVMNLSDREQDPQDYADDVYGRVAISCPELFDRTDVKALMNAWGIDPSAG